MSIWIEPSEWDELKHAIEDTSGHIRNIEELLSSEAGEREDIAAELVDQLNRAVSDLVRGLKLLQRKGE